MSDSSAHRLVELTKQTLGSEIKSMLLEAGVANVTSFGTLNTGEYTGHMALGMPDGSFLVIPVLAYTQEEFLKYAGFDFMVMADNSENPFPSDEEVSNGGNE